MSKKPLGEPFAMPLFCPECFEPLGDGNRLYPTPVNPTGVGCESCWINPLCPDGCNGVHGSPVPRGARMGLRRYSVAGTWACPTTGENYAYVGPNTEDGWADHDNWSIDSFQHGSYLNPDRTEWFYTENDWHEWESHDYCDECDRYYTEDPDTHYDDYHYQPDYYYDDDPGYGNYDADPDPSTEWQAEVFYYNPITEEVSDVPGTGFLPLPEVRAA